MKLLLLLITLLPTAALAETDLDQKLSCTVAASNQPGMPLGGPAVTVTLRQLRDSGSLFINGRLIEFYGPLTETSAQGGLTVLARKSGEFVGSLLALPRDGKRIELRILIAHTLTGQDKATGGTTFLLVNLPELFDVIPELYTLSCAGA